MQARSRSNETSVERRFLWGLLPGRADGHAVVVAVQRQNLVHAAHHRPQIIASRKIVHALAERFRMDRVLAMQEARRYPALRKPRYNSWRRRRRMVRL
ncbi:hypothetical protein [Mesorhizobium sp. BHbdii]